ncbi:MAG: hypothetical protein JNL60_02315 [Bacteroidia bacterium]|nr:hypothetical protein [Bacteroidia bacterium]
MSQRFSLFYAGYTSYIPSLYFNQLAFIESINDENNSSLQDCLGSLSTTVSNRELEVRGHLVTARSLAEHFKIPIPDAPQHHVEYFGWLRQYIDAFESQFPMSRIDHYYFLYARKIAEIACNIGLLRTYNQVYATKCVDLDLSAKYNKCLKDTEYILFKLMAAAALLSSQPRQNYFNSYYKSLSEEFSKFKSIEISGLSAERLTEFNDLLKEYEVVLGNGFKGCISLLKELGI